MVTCPRLGEQEGIKCVPIFCAFRKACILSSPLALFFSGERPHFRKLFRRLFIYPPPPDTLVVLFILFLLFAHFALQICCYVYRMCFIYTFHIISPSSVSEALLNTRADPSSGVAPVRIGALDIYSHSAHYTSSSRYRSLAIRSEQSVHVYFHTLAVL